MDQQVKKKWYKRWWFIILAGVFVVVIFSSIGGKPDVVTTTVSSSVSIGSEGYLRTESSQIVTISRTKEAYDEFVKSASAKDTYGMAKLVLEDRAFDVPVGTKVLVIDQTFGGRKVRILEGKHISEDG